MFSRLNANLPVLTPADRISDYASWTSQTKNIQQSLIAMSSGIQAIDDVTGEGDLFRSSFLHNTNRLIHELRKAVHLILVDVTRDLAVDHRSPLDNNYDEYLDNDSPTSDATLVENPEEAERRLLSVTDRLKRECQLTPLGSRHQSKEKLAEVDGATPTGPSAEEKDLPTRLRDAWARFKDDQNEKVANILSSGDLEDPDAQLSTEVPQSSRKEALMHEYDAETGLPLPSVEARFNATVMRVKSFLYGFEVSVTHPNINASLCLSRLWSKSWCSSMPPCLKRGSTLPESVCTSSKASHRAARAPDQKVTCFRRQKRSRCCALL
jgi:hypothetical protein